MPNTPLLKRSFGNSDRKITIVGLGGEGVLRTFGKEKAAQEVIETALAEGIGYFDSARAYSGSEAYYGLVWTRRPQDRARIFQTSKSGLRTKKEALQELDLTLRNMGTDYLDLWQIHDVRTEEDFQTIAGPGGALEAFTQAKASGKIRFIGLTGHHDPEILTRAVKAWPIDSVLIPVNPIEGNPGRVSDLHHCGCPGQRGGNHRDEGPGGFELSDPQTGITAELLIRFALSQPITLAIVGCSTPEEVKTLARIGRHFEPLSPEEQQQILDLYSPYARRLAFYRGVI